MIYVGLLAGQSALVNQLYELMSAGVNPIVTSFAEQLAEVGMGHAEAERQLLAAVPQLAATMGAHMRTFPSTFQSCTFPSHMIAWILSFCKFS